MYLYTYLHMSIYLWVLCVCVCACARTYIYMYIYICACQSMYIYMYQSMYIYMCRCMLYIHVYILVHVECLHTRPSIYPSFFIPTWNFSFPNSQGAYYFIFYVSFCLCALLPFASFVLSFQQAGACRTLVQF